MPGREIIFIKRSTAIALLLLTRVFVDAQGLTISSGAYFIANNSNLIIYSNFTNNGAFTNSGGTVIFAGAAQTFAGTTNTVFNNIIVNPGSTTTVSTSQRIAGILLSNGSVNANGMLTLLSTATQTALIDGSGAGSVTGSLTMQRYLGAGYGYKYFSSPFTAATVGSFSSWVNLTATFANFYNYIENQATSGFTVYTTATNPLSPLQGYAADFGTATTPVTISITGVVNNGALSTTLYNHNQTYTLGFNLAGNPYPSPIDWNAASGWTKTNIDNAIYYFDSGSTSQYTGTYSTYINGVSSDGVASNIIASMQGFFVHVTNGSYPVTGTFALTNSVRVNNLAPVFHKATLSLLVNPRILLRLSANFSDNPLSADPLVVYFDDKATPAFDNGLDAIKLMNTNGQVPNIYSLTAAGQKLVINALPKPDTLMVVPLGLQTSRDGVITFKLRNAGQWSANLPVYLTDAVTGVNQNLQQNPTFSVSVKQGTYENRFSLRCMPLNIPATSGAADEMYVYSAGGNPFVHINLVINQKGYLIIRDIRGMIISRKAVSGNGDYELDGNMPVAIYIVSFINAAGVHSKKVFLRSR